MKKPNDGAMREANRAALESYLEAGIERVLVLAADDSCADCKARAGHPMVTSGARTPPFHDGCRCAVCAVVD